MSIENSRDGVAGEQSQRLIDGKFFKQHRMGEFPGNPNIAVDVYGMNDISTWGYVIREKRGNSPRETRQENFGPESWRHSPSWSSSKEA